MYCKEFNSVQLTKKVDWGRCSDTSHSPSLGSSSLTKVSFVGLVEARSIIIRLSEALICENRKAAVKFRSAVGNKCIANRAPAVLDGDLAAKRALFDRVISSFSSSLACSRLMSPKRSSICVS